MPEKMIVEAPDGKVIEFPDGMTGDQVSAEMMKLYPAEQPKAKGWTDILPMALQRIKENLTAGGRTLTAPGEFPLLAPFQQYSSSGPVFGPDKTVSERLVNAIPFVGPSINEAVKQAAGGQPAESAATLTSDILIPGLAAKLPAQADIPALKASAAENWRRVLEPSGRQLVKQAEKITPELAETKITAISRKSLQEKLAAGKAEYGPQTGTAFDTANPVNISDWIDSLQKIRERHIYVKGTNKIPANRMGLEQGLANIENDLTDLADPKTGAIPAQILDNYVDDLNKGLVNAKGEYAQQPPKVRRFIESRTAGALREILDSDNPSGAAVNKVYHMYALAEDMMEKGRLDRITAQSALQKGSSKGFGAAIKKALPGPVRELPNAVSNIFDSVPWQTVSAASKMRIADMLSQGKFGDANLAMAVILLPKGNVGSSEQTAPKNLKE
jgi:hypothetical protein